MRRQRSFSGKSTATAEPDTNWFKSNVSWLNASNCNDVGKNEHFMLSCWCRYTRLSSVCLYRRCYNDSTRINQHALLIYNNYNKYINTVAYAVHWELNFYLCVRPLSFFFFPLTSLPFFSFSYSLLLSCSSLRWFVERPKLPQRVWVQPGRILR